MQVILLKQSDSFVRTNNAKLDNSVGAIILLQFQQIENSLALWSMIQWSNKKESEIKTLLNYPVNYRIEHNK